MTSEFYLDWKTCATYLVAAVIALHALLAFVQLFLGSSGFVRRRYGLEPGAPNGGVGLIVSIGFYNLLMVAGMVWGLLADSEFTTMVTLLERSDPVSIKMFFLSQAFAAGIFTSIVLRPKILITVFQTLPAAAALVFVALANAT